jgi:hypothetical protein
MSGDLTCAVEIFDREGTLIEHDRERFELAEPNASDRTSTGGTSLTSGAPAPSTQGVRRVIISRLEFTPPWVDRPHVMPALRDVARATTANRLRVAFDYQC